MQFWKMAETDIAPQFFSGNIVNIIHGSPLIKMAPLVESSGGAWGPILAHGLLPVSIINQDEIKINFHEAEWRPFWILHDPYFSSFQNPFQSIQHPEKPNNGHFDHSNWSTGTQDIDISVFQNGFRRPFWKSFSWVATMIQHVYPSFLCSWGGPLNEFY